MKFAPSSPAKSAAASVRRSASARTSRRRARRGRPSEQRVEVEAGRDAVDAVTVERVAHLVEVLRRELLRVVELVVVDQVAEALDRAAYALRRRLAGHSGL